MASNTGATDTQKNYDIFDALDPQKNSAKLTNGIGRVGAVCDAYPALIPDKGSHNLIYAYLVMVLPNWMFPLLLLCFVLLDAYLNAGAARKRVWLSEQEFARAKQKREQREKY